MVEETEMERICVKAFRETSGDMTVLASFADWVEENQPERTRFVKLLRQAGLEQNPAVYWFYRQQSYSFEPLAETHFEAMIRQACQHAYAEAWVADRRFNIFPFGRYFYLWRLDYDVTEEDNDDEWDWDWQCELIERTPTQRLNPISGLPELTYRETCVASLSGIDLGDGYPPGKRAEVFIRCLEATEDDPLGPSPDDYCRVVMAELAQQLPGYLADLPDWMRDESQDLVNEAVIFRKRVSSHPFEPVRYYAIMPERPHKATSPHGDQHYDVSWRICEYVWLGRDPTDTPHVTGDNYAGLMRRSEAVPDWRDNETCVKLHTHLRATGIYPVVMNRAPRGYSKNFKSRHAEEVAAAAEIPKATEGDET